MTTSFTRRDLLKLAGGSAVGLIVSPLPWKLLDDTAIWTQNWKSIPKLSGGPIAMLTSSCPLCPAGCAIQVRTAGGVPTAIKGAASDPVGCGTVCPTGLAGHHLAFHPLRPAQPLITSGRSAGSPVASTSYDAAYRLIGETIGRLRSHSLRGSVVVAGTSSDKAATSAWESLLNSLPDAQVVLQPSADDRTLTILRGLAAVDPGPLAFAPAQARTILSFGAPVLDGWHGYGLLRLKKQRSQALRIIQVETFPSRTALAADRWLRIHPGTEGLLALAIAKLLVEADPAGERSAVTITDRPEFASAIREVSLDQAATATGIGLDVIRQTAAELAGGPSIVIAGCDPAGGPHLHESERLIAGLNFLIGNPSATGGVIAVHPIPGSGSGRKNTLDEIPDASVGMLVLDGFDSGYHLPIEAVRRKLIPGTGIVVALTPILTPLAASADIILPVAAAYEALSDTVSQSMTGATVFGVTPPLYTPAGKSPDTIDIIRQIALQAGITLPEGDSTSAVIDRRIGAIAASGRGSIVNPVSGTGVALSSLPGASDLKERLMRGERWVDALPADQADSDVSMRCSVGSITEECTRGAGEGKSITLMPFGARTALSTGMISPMLSKVFQETGLRELDGTALINPETARIAGLAQGSTARLTTGRRSTSVTVRFMSTVHPGVVHVAVGPRPNGTEHAPEDCIEGITELTAAEGQGTWRIVQATIDGGSSNG